MQRWIEELARWMGRLIPDAITASVFMMTALFGAALALGNPPGVILEAWYRGLWMLLPFTMQMTLIIVLGGVVGMAPAFRKGVAVLAELPRTTGQVVAGVVLVNASLSYLSWGLGTALSPIIAICFARAAERKGIAVDFLFLLAAGGAAVAAWQFGLSASAPLLVATPGHFLESMVGVLPLAKTIWTPASILQEVLYVGAVIAAGRLLMPSQRRPLSMFPEAAKVAEQAPAAPAAPASFSERLEHHSFAALLVCASAAAWLYVHFVTLERGADINSLNAIFLFLSFLLHRSVHRVTKALQQAILSCWPVVVIYHLYAGLAGLIQYTNVGERFAGLLAQIATPLTFPLLAALSGAVVSVFVPSSGGQWAIQGFVTAKAAMTLGVSVPRGLLALSVGDHVGNLLTPFWYMVAAGIARVSFREFIGYGMIFAVLWFTIGVAVFTFAPC